MSAAEDPLVSFIFYIAVVAPVTSFFLKPNKKFSRSTGLLLAVGFLASIAAIKSVSVIIMIGSTTINITIIIILLLYWFAIIVT